MYTWPTKQVFCLYLRRIFDNESFWMSLKSTFLAFKKSCRNRGEGGEVIWTKSKRTAAFFRDVFPYWYWCIYAVLLWVKKSRFTRFLQVNTFAQKWGRVYFFDKSTSLHGQYYQIQIPQWKEDFSVRIARPIIHHFQSGPRKMSPVLVKS